MSTTIHDKNKTVYNLKQDIYTTDPTIIINEMELHFDNQILDDPMLLSEYNFKKDDVITLKKIIRRGHIIQDLPLKKFTLIRAEKIQKE